MKIRNVLAAFAAALFVAGYTTTAPTIAGAASVGFSSATATFYEPELFDWNPSKMIDGIFVGFNGWSIFEYSNGYGSPGTTSSQTALLTIASPLAAGQYNLTFDIYQNYPGHQLGDFVLGYTTDPSPTLSSAMIPVSIQGASSLHGLVFSSPSPGELFVAGPDVEFDTYRILASIDSASSITGILLLALKNPALPSDGPGRATNGNFVISEFTLDTRAQVPLPATLPLFATGLGALALLGWRRKRKALA